MSELNQDEMDKFLQDAMAEADMSAAAETPDADSVTPPVLDSLEGSASQDDIDALFAAVDDADGAEAPAAAQDPLAETRLMQLRDAQGDDDLEALFSAIGEDAATAVSDADGQATDPDIDLEGIANQDDIDALFSALGEDVEPLPGPAGGDGAAGLPAGQPEESVEQREHSTRLIESELAEAEAQADREASEPDLGLHALLSSIAGEEELASESELDELDTELDEMDPLAASSTTVVDDVDMDELLRQVADSAPPAPPAAAPPPQAAPGADTTVLSPDISAALASRSAPAAEAPPPRSPTTVVSVPPSAPVSLAEPSQRREYSVLSGAGEVETFANQINALLNSMSEKAHGYMQAWIAADSEARELRARALAEERRRVSLESEKTALAGQLDELRGRIGDLEGARVAAEEARLTLETAAQAKQRELESRVHLLASEAETLKDELDRTRNQATGVDIESRRARFEAERLKNEVESERMERIRVQRALENREKEMQVLQAQSSGQASSLFIDELHRLVRRLESELDSRSAGAHDALKQVDRLEVTDSMVPVVANLRAALLQALGQEADADDALKSLGREASGIKGPAAVAPEKAEMVSFETALSTYNLVGAVDVAGALLREAGATPSSLMKRVYQCQALRRPEVTDRLPDLSRLLEGLRTVQEANDRSRGSESGESEVFYVHMFDFLHNLVKLKLINRMSGDIWRIFLDLRGRFSFVTSDKQWAEYRDSTLGGNGRI